MNSKRFVAALMVLAMLLCIPVTARAAETTTIASGISVPSGWQQVCEVYTANWGGALDAGLLTADGYFTLHFSGENIWSVHVALNGAAWTQVDRDASTFTVLEDGSYMATFNRSEYEAGYGSDFSGLGAIYAYTNSGDGAGVTVHSLTYTATEEKPEVVNTYIVAGSAGLCGSEWNGVDPANKMADEDGDGIYTITYYGVAAGTYEFKVVENGQNWYGDSNWNNMVLNLDAKSDVTISFDPAAILITVSVTALEEPGEPEEPVINTYVVAGSAGLCGSEWNGTDVANQMTDEDGDGIYTITYYGVAAGTYEFKVVENGQNWYGDNGNNVILNLGAKCDVTISFDSATHAITTSVSGGEIVDDGTRYIVAGVSELCGSFWEPSDAANQMSDEDGDGVYTKTYYGVEPGNYEYKVVANLPDGTVSWLCNDGWSNEVVSVEETCDVTICYDRVSGRIYAEGTGVNTEKTIANCVVAGFSSLCGSEWDAGDLNNQMLDEDGDGVYAITYYGVAPGYYEFKVVENLSNGTRNWLTNNPYGNNMNLNLTWRTHVTVTYDSNTGEIAVYKKGQEYTAALGFGDADWWPNTGLEGESAATTIVDGEGNYTLIWDVPGTCWGATAEGVVCFYIDIEGAYADIAKNTVVTAVTVKADGVEIPVDMSKVRIYDADGDYRIELTNLSWAGGYTSVDSEFVIDGELIVSFTLGSGNATTGDSTNLVVLCGAMLVSAMGIVALVVNRKKFI